MTDQSLCGQAGEKLDIIQCRTKSKFLKQCRVSFILHQEAFHPGGRNGQDAGDSYQTDRRFYGQQDFQPKAQRRPDNESFQRAGSNKVDRGNRNQNRDRTNNDKQEDDMPELVKDYLGKALLKDGRY